MQREDENRASDLPDMTPSAGNDWYPHGGNALVLNAVRNA